MTEATIEASTAPLPLAEHDCIYETSLQQFIARSMGSHTLAAWQLHGLQRDLADIHADGVCPPARVDNGPTLEWSDWVKRLRP